MTDILTRQERSERMALIRSKDTKPELFVRKLIFSLGYRYRLHAKSLPGQPDIVFTRRKKVIFVHGCFWHQHPNCKGSKIPKSRLDYWKPKLEGNRKRDLRIQRELRNQGWGVMVIWECQLRDAKKLKRRIVRFLEK